MARPELKQFDELKPEDFERHPVWIGCHTADYGKSWYENTNEETFRPRTGKLPADFSEGMLLVKANFELPDGSRYTGFVTPSDKENDFGTQQPQVFIGDQRFGFCGGMIGISDDSQQALYNALNKNPDEIFPLRFSGNPELASGIMTGQIEGFYVRGGAHGFSVRKLQSPTVGSKWFRIQAHGGSGHPQPEKDLKYRELTYQNRCPRCGIHAGQCAPFRFKKSQTRSIPGFWQPSWIYDAFFVSPNTAIEIGKAGITGVSFGPVLNHRTGTELTDRVQLLALQTFSCAEATHLPTVTCRPDNEEVSAMRKRWPPTPENELSEEMRRLREKIAALPYCGRVKYHPPTSLAIIPGSLDKAPDFFQSAEWVGGGALAYRLTFASERFVALIREHKWKGLVFSEVYQQGFSERKELNI